MKARPARERGPQPWMDPMDMPSDESRPLADRALPPAPAPDEARKRDFLTVRPDDEILVCIGSDNEPSIAFYLSTSCDLLDCLDLAQQFSRLRGVTRISMHAHFGWSERYPSWTWHRARRAKRYSR